MVLLNRILLTFVVYFLLTSAFAIEESGADTVASFNLTHHIVGYLSILLSVSAYVAAMSEEVIHLRKSKPMVLESLASKRVIKRSPCTASTLKLWFQLSMAALS